MGKVLKLMPTQFNTLNAQYAKFDSPNSKIDSEYTIEWKNRKPNLKLDKI